MNQGFSLMSAQLSIILIIVSVLNLVFVLMRIRKSKILIIDSIFWILFSIFLIIIACFPNLVYYVSRFVGIQTPSNFIYTFIIFLLIVKSFLMSMKLSQLEIKLKVISQKIALDEYRNKEIIENKEINVEKKSNISMNE